LFTFVLGYGDITEKSVHAVLLLHKDSRIALVKILKLLHYFILYTSSKNYQLEQFAESQSLLQRFTSTLLNDEIIAIKDTIAFLNALDGLERNTTGKGDCIKPVVYITHVFS
jgi:hypothetical protein